MKRIDWKNVAGAAFFAAALLGSGLARALEASANDPRANMVCSCSRVAFNDPECQTLKNQVFGTGGVDSSNPHNGAGAMMPQNPAQAPAQSPQKVI